jgi:hypothetical protein
MLLNDVNVIINKTKVFLSQEYVTLYEFGYLWPFGFIAPIDFKNLSGVPIFWL